MQKFLILFTVAVVIIGFFVYKETRPVDPTIPQPESEKYDEYYSQFEKETAYIPGSREDDEGDFQSQTVSIETGDVVATPKKVSEPAVTESVYEEPEEIINEEDYLIVRYTKDGFKPPELIIALKDTVRFVNQGDRPMWIRVIQKEKLGRSRDKVDYYHTYATFDQGKSVSQGGEFLYTFVSEGRWEYENVSDPSAIGVIKVK